MSSCFVCKTNVTGRQHALECDVCRQWTTFFCARSDGYTVLVLVRGRKFQGTKVPGSESSTYGTWVGYSYGGNGTSCAWVSQTGLSRHLSLLTSRHSDAQGLNYFACLLLNKNSIQFRTSRVRLSDCLFNVLRRWEDLSSCVCFCFRDM